jgi:hypothetical protein
LDSLRYSKRLFKDRSFCAIYELRSAPVIQIYFAQTRDETADCMFSGVARHLLDDGQRQDAQHRWIASAGSKFRADVFSIAVAAVLRRAQPGKWYAR